jgi:hypothetical protein
MSPEIGEVNQPDNVWLHQNFVFWAIILVVLRIRNAIPEDLSFGLHSGYIIDQRHN